MGVMVRSLTGVLVSGVSGTHLGVGGGCWSIRRVLLGLGLFDASRQPTGALKESVQSWTASPRDAQDERVVVWRQLGFTGGALEGDEADAGHLHY